MVLLYIAALLAQLWSGFNGIQLGWRALRRVWGHHRPFAMAAFGASFMAAGLFVCVVSPYQAYRAGWF